MYINKVLREVVCYLSVICPVNRNINDEMYAFGIRFRERYSSF